MPVKQDEPAAVNLSIQLYRYLVGLLPGTFRLEYGDLMVQVFHDSCLQTCRQNNGSGLVRLWGRTLIDTLLTGIEQYSNRGVMMTKSSWIKLSGWAMSTSSILFVISWLASSRPEFNEFNALSWPIDRFLNAATVPLMVMAGLLIAVGILGLRAHFGQQAGSLGQAGLFLSLVGSTAGVVGFVGVSISDTSPWWQTAMLGFMALFVGLFLFGLRCSQRKLFSRWNNIPLLTSMVWPVLMLFSVVYNGITNSNAEVPEAIIALVSITAFGGLGVLGILLQAEAGKPQSNPV